MRGTEVLWGPLRRGYPPGVGGPEVHRGGAARVGPVRMGHSGGRCEILVKLIGGDQYQGF